MHPNSPYFEWHPDSIGWLHRRHRNGQWIGKTDVERLARAARDFMKDDLMQYYAWKVLSGTLGARRGARAKMENFGYFCRFILAMHWLPDIADDIDDERRLAGTYRQRGQLEPCVEAADRVGRYFRLPMGRSLLTAISSWKSRLNS